MGRTLPLTTRTAIVATNETLALAPDETRSSRTTPAESPPRRSVFVLRAHLRRSTATIAFMAERSSAGQRTGDSLVAEALVGDPLPERAKAVVGRHGRQPVGSPSPSRRRSADSRHRPVDAPPSPDGGPACQPDEGPVAKRESPGTSRGLARHVDEVVVVYFTISFACIQGWMAHMK
jgi:hypothetical protein